ncbi:MAG: hypothetical protein JW989_00615 [Chlorobiaceae bacterium]|nr:hypothetical protein [Chlorobiaceae bacterium]
MPRQRDRTRRACFIARWCGASRVTALLRGDEDRLFFGLRIGKVAAATGTVIYARNK